MQAILGKIHWFIILYVVAMTYMSYTEHEEKVRRIDASIPAIKNKIKKNKKKLKQLNGYFKDIAEAKERIELVASEIEKLQKKLPSTFSDTENLGTIKKIAEGLNIKNIYLTPLAEEKKGFYYAKKYEFKATGTFLQFLIFFEKISENERLLNINEIRLFKTDNKQRGRFQLINSTALIEAYRYNDSYKEERGIEKLQKEFDKKAKAPRRPRRKRKARK